MMGPRVHGIPLLLVAMAGEVEPTETGLTYSVSD